MSYGSNSAPRRQGGGGLIFFIIIGIGIFLFMNSQGGNVGTPQGQSPSEIMGTQETEEERLEREILGGGGDFDSGSNRKMPTGRADRSGDWEIDDVSTKSSADSRQAPRKNETKSSGDWEIDDVNTTNTNKDRDRSNQYKFSKESEGKSSGESGGDWSIEDAGGETKNKKVEKGDWSIEETNTNKK